MKKKLKRYSKLLISVAITILVIILYYIKEFYLASIILIIYVAYNAYLGINRELYDENVNTLNIKISELSKDYNDIGRDKDKDNFNLNSKRKLLFETNNKIDILKTNLANMNKVQYSVRCIVGNPVLRGIHNILGSLIEAKEEHVSMVEIALGGSINNIVVNDEGCAKEAIEYLKNLFVEIYTSKSKQKNNKKGKTITLVFPHLIL